MLMQQKSKTLTRRALMLLVVVVIMIGALFSRFIYIQAAKEVQGRDLQELLEQRWSQTAVLDGQRGTIYDRNGETIAEEIPSYTVLAVLDDQYESHVADPEGTARALAEVLDEEQEFLYNQLTRDAVQVELGPRAKNISYEKRQELEELELEGILFREDPRRYYPRQTFASHVIGYTERDMSVARMGLESSLNDYLAEENGSIQYQRDGRNRRLYGAEETIVEPKNGSNVFLTLDSRIQQSMEQTMAQVDEEYNPERMMAIVANAKTGEILGMSNRPSFNPNQYESIENYTNFAVSSRFEPGSTLKIFSLAAMIEEGVYDGNAYYESGSYRAFGETMRDHNNGRGWGTITYEEGVQRSSNVAFAKLTNEYLGGEKIYEYMERFGFREPTGVDLPNEASGVLAENGPLDALTTSFGQASVVTPIQQIKAATAIANDGQMMKPYIVKEIIDPNSGEATLVNEPEVVSEPISAETATEVRRIMETIVSSENGTGQPYAIDGFEIAGKTGTAQLVGDDGLYMRGHGNNIFSFIGMAPADDPEVIVYVAVDRPDLEEYQLGNEPVSLIFRQVMEQSLQYLNIAPSDEEDTATLETGKEIRDYEGERVDLVTEELTAAGLEPILIGDGTMVEAQSIEAGVYLAKGDKVLLLTNAEAISMPDITGFSVRQVYRLAEMLDITADVEGMGFVYGQQPEPGADLTNATKILVEASPEEPEEPEESEDGEAESEEEEFFMD
ncbi:penicillin-binding protein [Paenalkalicoccus suaedae]|uniref:serine-type D-Ala-D-Ala carboxypeptidase n=1 Tax=Paenalkalicoccus suaedae TaxID=2592382 RepID=A0A859FFD8_9BACI|nr:penicillin-binding protein [Paenalkalicoccus suaedae]QKS71528.1 penicillin-binding protein [Paenalkalicoccus suaedae]